MAESTSPTENASQDAGSAADPAVSPQDSSLQQQSPIQTSSVEAGTNTTQSGLTQYTNPYGARISPPRGLPSLYNPANPPIPDHLQVSDDSIPAIVSRLCNPEPEFYSTDGNTVTLTLTWAIGKIGVEHVEYGDPPLDERRVLRQDSSLRAEGLSAGLPAEIMAWLIGAPDSEELVLPVEKLRLSNAGEQ